MEIKDRLEYVLSALNLSPAEAAEKTGIPYRSLYNYTKGMRKPDAESLSRLGEHLDISLNWLLTGRGEMFTDPAKSPTTAVQNEPYVSPMARKAAEMMSGWTEDEQKEFFKRVEEKYKQIENQKKQAEEMEALKAQMQELERLLHKSA